MEKVSNLLKEKKKHTVNVNKEYLPTVNSNKTVNEQIEDFLSRLNIKPDSLADIIATSLGDQKSIDYWKIMAKETPVGKLFEALSITKTAAREGKILSKKAVYFQGILRRWGFRTKFKK